MVVFSLCLPYGLSSVYAERKEKEKEKREGGEEEEEERARRREGVNAHTLWYLFF